MFSKSVFSRSVFSRSGFSRSVFSRSGFSRSVFSRSGFSRSVFSRSGFSRSVFSRSGFSRSVFSRSGVWGLGFRGLCYTQLYSFRNSLSSPGADCHVSISPFITVCSSYPSETLFASTRTRLFNYMHATFASVYKHVSY